MHFKRKNKGFTPSNYLKGNSRGFTLVEALVAIAIMIVGILSALVLVTRVLYSTTIIQDRLTASFLAQEGMELVRQIRDTNFIKKLNREDVDWSNGLEAGNYIIDARDLQLTKVESDNIPNLLYDNGSGYYNYLSGDPTFFKREIIIEQINANQIRVKVLMNWKSKGINFDLEVENHLFNWLGI